MKYIISILIILHIIHNNMLIATTDVQNKIEQFLTHTLQNNDMKKLADTSCFASQMFKQANLNKCNDLMQEFLQASSQLKSEKQIKKLVTQFTEEHEACAQILNEKLDQERARCWSYYSALLRSIAEVQKSTKKHESTEELVESTEG